MVRIFREWFFVSLFIVANTIRITIYNRRLEISIMKAVGATNTFIRIPFFVEGMLVGHLVAGVAEIARCARELGVRKELTLMLQHMILSHHDLPEYGSPKPPMFPEAEMLHMIDDMDAKMNEMETVQKRTPAGAFSEKIWSLDRKLYRRKDI